MQQERAMGRPLQSSLYTRIKWCKEIIFGTNECTVKQRKEEKRNSRKGYTFTQLTFITRKKAGRRQADRQTDILFQELQVFTQGPVRFARTTTQMRDRSICFYLASAKDKPELRPSCY